MPKSACECVWHLLSRWRQTNSITQIWCAECAECVKRDVKGRDARLRPLCGACVGNCVVIMRNCNKPSEGRVTLAMGGCRQSELQERELKGDQIARLCKPWSVWKRFNIINYSENCDSCRQWNGFANIAHTQRKPPHSKSRKTKSQTKVGKSLWRKQSEKFPTKKAPNVEVFWVWVTIIDSTLSFLVETRNHFWCPEIVREDGETFDESWGSSSWQFMLHAHTSGSSDLIVSINQLVFKICRSYIYGKLIQANTSSQFNGNTTISLKSNLLWGGFQ